MYPVQLGEGYVFKVRKVREGGVVRGTGGMQRRGLDGGLGAAKLGRRAGSSFDRHAGDGLNGERSRVRRAGECCKIRGKMGVFGRLDQRVMEIIMVPVDSEGLWERQGGICIDYWRRMLGIVVLMIMIIIVMVGARRWLGGDGWRRGHDVALPAAALGASRSGAGGVLVVGGVESGGRISQPRRQKELK